MGLAFSKFVDCRRSGRDWICGEWFVIEDWRGKVGIGFYMCLCCCCWRVVVGSRVGANSMVMTWENIGCAGCESLITEHSLLGLVAGESLKRTSEARADD